MTHTNNPSDVRFRIIDHQAVSYQISQIAHKFGIDAPKHIKGDYYSATQQAWEVFYRNFPYNVLGCYSAH